MKTHPIVLPDQPHFELSELAEHLADRHPPTPDDVKGLDCITSKLPAKFCLDKTPQFLYQNKRFIPRQKLNEEDKKILGDILPSLPTVTHFMTDKEIDIFFVGYYKVDKRPSWEPDITSPSDRENMRLDYERRLHTHCQRFVAMAEKGDVKALDSKFDIVSAKSWSPEYIRKRKLLVTKRDAVTFLSDYGVEVSFESQTTESSSDPTKRRPKADLLNAMIEDLYRQHGQDSEDNKIWLELKKLAAARTYPFTSDAKDLICYEDEGSRSVTRKSFMARLSRRKEKVQKA